MNGRPLFWWVLGILLGVFLSVGAEGASYSLQVDASKNPSSLQKLGREAQALHKKTGKPIFLVKKDSFYALLVGKFTKVEDAKALKGRMAVLYPDAFVIPWNGFKVVKAVGQGVPGSPKVVMREVKKGKKQPVEKSLKKVRKKEMYPRNFLVRLRTLKERLVLTGQNPWGFVDLERLGNPVRYVVHLFNTRPSLTLDTLYAPLKGVEKAKVFFDYKERKTDVVLYTTAMEPLVMDKEGKDLFLYFKEAVEEARVKEMPSPGLGGAFGARKYTGKRVSLEFKKADIRDVIRLISEVSSMNFVVDPDVKGTVTVKLDSIPWDQALDIILKTNRLGRVMENGVVRVATLKSLSQEGSAQESARKALEKVKPLVMEVIPLNFTDASKVKTLIDPLLSDQGKVDYLERINALVVKDNAERIAKIRKFVKEIDTPTPQIQIGARIVEIVTTYLKELGIQWGFLWRQTKTDMSFPYSFGVGGGVTPAPATGQALTTMEGVSGWSPASIAPGYVVDLPAAAMTGSGGAIAASLLNASETFGLDIRLSALEEEGMARTVSNPKLVTLDNQEAEISQGYEIPFATVSESGTQTEFKEAKLKLLVKPHITSSGDIVMDVEVSKDSPDFTHVTPDGVPIQTRSVKTSVRMKNGDTLIIGGIYEMTKSKKNNQVPGLSRIPLLSWLFRHRTENLEKRELLIFITPSVIEAGIAQRER